MVGRGLRTRRMREGRNLLRPHTSPSPHGRVALLRDRAAYWDNGRLARCGNAGIVS